MANRDETTPYRRLPLGANSLDACVSANFLFGLIYQLNYEYEPSLELRQMIRDTTDFLVYCVEDAV